MKNWINKYWKDPVISTVIAGIILAILTSIYLMIKSFVSQISFMDELYNLFSFLGNSTPIYNWLLIVTLIIFSILIFKLLSKRRKITHNYRHTIDKQKKINTASKSLNNGNIKRKETENKPTNTIKIPETIIKKEPEIYEISTSFFYHRVSGAFPGIRGLKWFSNPEVAVQRLQLLLTSPLTFKYSHNNECRTDPIWWFRGNNSMFINHFRTLSKTKCLMNIQELEIERIAVYHGDAYYKDFIYVETKPEKPIGIYDTSKENIIERIKHFGCVKEEFGLYKGKPITRNEYDDGAAIIKGKVVDIIGATELRVRYLSKYNFIIAAADSPYNSTKFDTISEEYLNGILNGTHTLEELVDKAEPLRKNEN